MPDESQGFTDKKRTGGDEAPKVALVPDVVVNAINGEGENTGGNIMELDDFSKAKHGLSSDTLKGNDGALTKSKSPVSVEVGVAKKVQSPEPLESLTKGTTTTTDHANPVTSSSDRLHAVEKSTTSNFGEEISELDGFEKTNQISPVKISAHSVENSHSSPDDDRGVFKTDSSLSGSSPTRPFKLPQTRDSIDVRWDDEDRGEDKKSTRSRQSVKEGVCCCYHAFHRAFLQCVEETPAMLTGLVLSLAFCVALIVLIPSTGRVRLCVCVCVCF
ncbi:hypothetical protein CgunFtcFv8_006183 [Champsocephalus gunnari]|uniref:Uncharacterized protein n=1 Tax=Champsocephalus gunnari TaxID=52237 RepID=A0AAN8BWS1_CHAGU|nr:hypothetical protein CgunFtcFv8_006183 [Champsocephalus gunnari]